MTPLGEALSQLGPNDRRRLRLLLARSGVQPHLIERFARGEGDHPAVWVQRTIAQALGEDVDRLWPES